MIFRCLKCNKLSFEVLCEECRVEVNLYRKDGVISFYRYDDIEFLLKFKYQKNGSVVFKYLSKPFAKFAKEFKFKAFVIPIEGKREVGYSHTAILAKAFNTSYLTPLYSSLIDKSNVRYAGKSFEFRKNHPRKFIYNGKSGIDAILVDDVKTTGLTLSFAKEVLKKHNVNVLFSVVLSDKSLV
ncbi:MAG: ComF family protein [Nautiliaceae bacterium]